MESIAMVNGPLFSRRYKKAEALNVDNTEVCEYCIPLYFNGAHTGNIYYKIDIWGMNSPARGAEIKTRLDEFISCLQVDWKGN